MEISGSRNRDVMRFYMGHVEFSGAAINYSKANLAGPQSRWSGQGRAKSGKSRPGILEILIARPTPGALGGGRS